MEEDSYVSMNNEAVILPCGPRKSLLDLKPVACTGSRRRKGQPVKRKIIECDEESCNSNTIISEFEVVANDVDRHPMRTAGVSEKVTPADSTTFSSSTPSPSEDRRFHIEPSTFAVDPSTIVIDSSNHVVSSNNSDSEKSPQNYTKRPTHQITSEECPPDPIPNLGSAQKAAVGIAEENANKPMDQMEMIRRLAMLVGSTTGSNQATALQLLLSSGNPALTLATTQLLSEQARLAALASLPSCIADGSQNDPQAVFSSMLNSSIRTESPAVAEAAKADIPNVATMAITSSSEKSATDAHSLLSFISKLLADSTNNEARNGASRAKPSSSSGTPSLPSASVTVPNTPEFLTSPSDSSTAVLLQPECASDSTPENHGNKDQVASLSTGRPVKKPNKVNSALLNSLSVTSRPVNQWSTSDMDAVLNSPLFRTLPRMSFRPPTKRKLFDDFSASTSSLHDSRPEIDDLESFAQHFKRQRIKLGYTQGDVGLALGRKYGTDFSQTTISRFEAMNLSFKNMCKLRPLLKEWLEGQEAAVANGVNVEELRTIEISKEKVEECVEEVPIHVANTEPIMKRRRKRTNLDLSQRKSLDTFFLANPRPGHEEMVRIANALDLERDVVRVWFCNRRQKLRRSEDLFPSIDSKRVKAKKPFPLNLSKDEGDDVVVLPEATEIATNSS
ncbi:unnamed protein product [Cylicocyclus nassatus]|uniref:POU domain protein n=1 Tax=Cylicocyclus nassatus TaxID=53992 RepID=A0AA36MHZ0_CYLNA|nr:unnamed protein product [Cylicocyclus nassatus]